MDGRAKEPEVAADLGVCRPVSEGDCITLLNGLPKNGSNKGDKSVFLIRWSVASWSSACRLVDSALRRQKGAQHGSGSRAQCPAEGQGSQERAECSAKDARPGRSGKYICRNGLLGPDAPMLPCRGPSSEGRNRPRCEQHSKYFYEHPQLLTNTRNR